MFTTSLPVIPLPLSLHFFSTLGLIALTFLSPALFPTLTLCRGLPQRRAGSRVGVAKPCSAAQPSWGCCPSCAEYQPAAPAPLRFLQSPAPACQPLSLPTACPRSSPFLLSQVYVGFFSRLSPLWGREVAQRWGRTTRVSPGPSGF